MMSYPEFIPLWSFSVRDDPPFVPLQGVNGMIVVDIFALLSSVALVSVAFRVIWLAIVQRISPKACKPKEYVFFNTQLGYYAICLLAGNIVTDVSGLIGFQWLLDRGITEGSLCIVQAVLMQAGNWANAYFTVAMAVHTFNSLVMQVRQCGIVSTITITGGWISAGLIAASPFINPQRSKLDPIYGVSDISCGIRRVHPKAQLFYHLFPIFIASLLSAILYSVIFLVLRGTLNIKGGVRLTLDPHERWSSGKVAENYHRFVARIARSMLWYPFAYIVLLIPYSVTRLLTLSGFTVPSGVIVFGYTCWFMLGVINVALLYNTFRVLGPVLDPPSQKENPMGYDPSKRYRTSKESYPTATFNSPTVASFGLRPTIRSPLLVHQERSTSVQSYYSRRSSFFGPSEREIDEFTLQRSTITSEEAVKFSPAVARSASLHSHQSSNEFVGLPAAPRPTRSNVLHDHNVEKMYLVPGAWSLVDMLGQRPASVQTFSQRDSESSCYSCDSAEYDPTNRDFRNPHNSHLMLDTVDTTLPPVSPRSSLQIFTRHSHHRSSFSAVPLPFSASPGRQRSVLVSGRGSE